MKNSSQDYKDQDSETKPVAQNWDSAKRRDGMPNTQVYLDMSKPHGVDASDASNDMWEAMLTPGGMLKKSLDSTYPDQQSVMQAASSSITDDEVSQGEKPTN